MQPVRRGDVWWVSFDPSVGDEIRKKRPAIVVSNNASNAVLNRIVVIPLTSKTGKMYPSEALVKLEGTEVKAMADQIMTASKGRLGSRIGTLVPEDVKAVEAAILLHLGIRRPG